MRTCHLIFISKNEKSLNNAFFFFKNLNFDLLQKIFFKKRKKQFFTLLKSPHVNKKAQEHFEYRTFFRQLTIYSPKNLKLLLSLRKINQNLFSDVKIKIKFSINKNKQKNIQINVFNFNNFKLNIIKNITNKNNISLLKYNKLKNENFNQNSKIKSFLQILDVYGELNISLT
jgi:hypothetical protein